MHSFTIKAIPQDSPASPSINARIGVSPGRLVSSNLSSGLHGSRAIRMGSPNNARRRRLRPRSRNGISLPRLFASSGGRSRNGGTNGASSRKPAAPSATSIDGCVRLLRSVSSKSHCQPRDLEFRRGPRIVGIAFVLFCCCRTILGNGAWKVRRLPPATGAFHFQTDSGKLRPSRHQLARSSSIGLGWETDRGFIVFGRGSTIRS